MTDNIIKMKIKALDKKTTKVFLISDLKKNVSK